jgi:murein DD-endopeptidase MepM/ murein hydrolase activator NlpD
MNYKTLAFLMALFCQPCLGLVLQNSAEALPPEAQAPCAFSISTSSKNLDYAPGAYWTTCNRYKFIFQREDRNVVLYSPSGVALWATGTNNYKADKFSIQSDGNVVLYEGNRAVWASNTSGNPGSLFVIQSDGNVVVYNPSGRPIFDTGTNGSRKSILSASRTWLTRYIPGLLPWSEEEWDKQSGDGYHFDNFPETKGGKTGISETSDELKQISKDLSKALLGSERYMTTGYAYDFSPPYYDGKTVSHAGIDYKANAGTLVTTVVPGKVVNVANYGSIGQFVTLEADDGNRWIYGHLSSNKKNGDLLKSGDSVGTVYNQKDNSHFHIEIQNAPADKEIIGGIFSQNKTQGKLEFVLSKTISPLQAYWNWRNR